MGFFEDLNKNQKLRTRKRNTPTGPAPTISDIIGNGAPAPNNARLGAKINQRKANTNVNAGAAGGAQTTDSSGTGANTPEPNIAPPQRPFSPLPQDVASQALENIQNTQNDRAFAAKPAQVFTGPTGATNPDGSPLPSIGGTVNYVNNPLGSPGSGFASNPDQEALLRQQRLASLIQNAPQKTPQVTPVTTPNTNEGPLGDRAKFYKEILSKAGRGPGGEISLRAALGAIANLEGQRLRADAAFRGQDVGLLEGNADRQSQAEIAANRNRTQELLGQSRITESAADRAQREAIAKAKLAQDQQQFKQNLGLNQQKIEQQRAAQEATALDRAKKLALEKQKAETLKAIQEGQLTNKVLGQAIGKDPVTGLPVFDPELYNLLETLVNPE